MTSKTKVLIACDVFREEIESFLPSLSETPVHIEWLEMGLHDQPDLLREQLQSRVNSFDGDASIGAILLAYGRCGNGLVGLRAGKHPLVVPQGHDCISIFLGGPEAHAKVLAEEPGTYFYSPGWIRERRVPGPDREAWLRRHYLERYPDDPEMVDELVDMDRELFNHHRCAACVDLTGGSITEDYTRRCARFLGWEFKKLRGDPSLLKTLLSGPSGEDSRFVHIKPGEQIGSKSDGQLAALPE